MRHLCRYENPEYNKIQAINWVTRYTSRGFRIQWKSEFCKQQLIGTYNIVVIKFVVDIYTWGRYLVICRINVLLVPGERFSLIPKRKFNLIFPNFKRQTPHRPSYLLFLGTLTAQ